MPQSKTTTSGAVPMQTAEHTPGPWKTWMGNPWNDNRGMCELVSTDDQHRTIAEIFSAGNLDERDANARLIAAAPELLNALLDILSCVEGEGWTLEETKTCVASHARAAIAKAKGAQS